MPSTKTITTYTLSELEGHARARALNWLLEGSLEYWWENICEEAEHIGLKIKSFDTNRANDIKGEFRIYDREVAKRTSLQMFF
jgi:hypothetical protein